MKKNIVLSLLIMAGVPFFPIAVHAQAQNFPNGSGGTSSLSGLTAATASTTLANGNNSQTWNCALTTDVLDCMAFGETSAATAGTLTNGLANQAIVSLSTATNSTATPFEVAQGAITNTVATPALQIEQTFNNAGLVGEGILYDLTNTASSSGSLPLDLRVNHLTMLGMSPAGLIVFNGSAPITSPPPSIPNNPGAGWKYCFFAQFQCVGQASNTTYNYFSNNGWLSMGFAVPANDGNASRPDSSANTSISTKGGLDIAENACSANFAGLASHSVLCADSTQKTAVVSTPNGTTTYSALARLVPSCLSVVPITVTANVSTDQNLMACTIPANLLSVVGRTIRLAIAAIYSTPAASSTAITISVKICSVSGCGSGNVLTAATITSAALAAIQVTNNAINLPVVLTTQTGGTTLAVEAHGCMAIDLAAAITGADTIYCDNNIATQVGAPSAIDATAQNFLQVTGTFSVASASNSMTERMLIPELLN